MTERLGLAGLDPPPNHPVRDCRILSSQRRRSAWASRRRLRSSLSGSERDQSV